LNNPQVAVLDFLWKHRVFDENAVTPHFIVGMCDSHHTVQRIGEDGLKRIKVNWENPKVFVKN
jgi:hypothetical protein